MFQLLVILFIIKLYARYDIFKFFNNKQRLKDILFVRKVLQVLRNVKEQNEQYLSLSCFYGSSPCELFWQNGVHQI